MEDGSHSTRIISDHGERQHNRPARNGPACSASVCIGYEVAYGDGGHSEPLQLVAVGVGDGGHSEPLQLVAVGVDVSVGGHSEPLQLVAVGVAVGVEVGAPFVGCTTMPCAVSGPPVTSRREMMVTREPTPN